MTDTRTRGFVRYLPLVLDALRSKNPEPLRQVLAFIRGVVQIPPEDLAGLLERGGLWTLTLQGAQTCLASEEAG